MQNKKSKLFGFLLISSETEAAADVYSSDGFPKLSASFLHQHDWNRAGHCRGNYIIFVFVILANILQKSRAGCFQTDSSFSCSVSARHTYDVMMLRNDASIIYTHLHDDWDSSNINERLGVWRVWKLLLPFLFQVIFYSLCLNRNKRCNRVKGLSRATLDHWKKLMTWFLFFSVSLKDHLDPQHKSSDIKSVCSVVNHMISIPRAPAGFSKTNLRLLKNFLNVTFNEI